MTLLDRLADGQPPLRPSELARLLGCSRETVRKLIRAGVLGFVRPPALARERRIPVSEARRLFE